MSKGLSGACEREWLVHLLQEALEERREAEDACMNQIAGLKTDLHLSPHQYLVCITCTYVLYIVAERESNRYKVRLEHF